MADLSKKYDVLVAGGGNAALCAAIAARRAGSSVLVCEMASKFYRGGNTRHTRNIRCAHDAATETLSGPYPEEEFFKDLLANTTCWWRVAAMRRSVPRSRRVARARACSSARWPRNTIAAATHDIPATFAAPTTPRPRR